MNSLLAYAVHIATAFIILLMAIRIVGWKAVFGLNRYYVTLLVSFFCGILLTAERRLISMAYLCTFISLLILYTGALLLTAKRPFAILMAVTLSLTWVSGVQNILPPWGNWSLLLSAASLFILLYPVKSLGNLTDPACLILSVIYILANIVLITYHSATLSAILLVTAALLTIIIILWQRLNKATTRAAELSELNAILESSYATVAEKISELYAETHDFKNQLRMIQGLPYEQTQQHLDELLGRPSLTTRHCQSRNSYLNAILNSKIDEATAKDIHISFSILLSQPIPLPSTEICAIIANQLDNAMEACLRIENPEDRQIHVVVEENMNFIAFIVKNSILPGSVPDDFEERSSKEGDRHGHGLSNIRKVAEMHGGSLHNTVTRDTFVSVATIQQ